MSRNLFIAQIVLALLGLIGVATAAPSLIPKHLLQTVAAILVTVVVARISQRWLLAWATPLWVTTLILLAAALVLGHGGNNSLVRRWIHLGPILFQPSEFAKLAIVLQLASFFARKGPDRKLLGALLTIGLTTGLILLEPDLGTTLLVFTLGLVVMYAAGVRFSSLSAIVIFVALVSLPVASFYISRHPYILSRYHSFTQGFTASNIQRGGFQVYESRLALGEGGVWGQGVDAVLPPVPAASTDMIASSVGFSLGLIGIAMLLLAYWLVARSGCTIAEVLVRRQQLGPEGRVACILGTGAMYMIVAQALLNLSVAVGLLPVTGIPLPMVSFGGSAQLAMGIAFGMLHGALKELRGASENVLGEGAHLGGSYQLLAKPVRTAGQQPVAK